MKVGMPYVLVFCLVESQMVIFNFEEAGDWNRACCHSNIKMCTICIIGKLEYLWHKKGYHEKKNVILLYFEKPFK